jgi:hypothetical protein
MANDKLQFEISIIYETTKENQLNGMIRIGVPSDSSGRPMVGLSLMMFEMAKQALLSGAQKQTNIVVPGVGVPKDLT